VSSAGSPLELAKYRNAHTDQTGRGEHAQQRIRDDHLKDITYHRCERTGRRDDAGQAAGSSTFLQSFLLPYKIMVAGPGVGPGAPDAKSGVLPMH